MSNFDHSLSKEVHTEAKAAIPISIELEYYIAAKFALAKDACILSYASSNKIDYKLIDRNRIMEDNIPLLNNLLQDIINDTGKNVCKKSIESCTNNTEDTAVKDIINRNEESTNNTNRIESNDESALNNDEIENNQEY